MVDVMKVNGMLTTCMVQVDTPGRMGVFTKAITLTIKSMALELTHGLMVVGILDSGSMESKMVKGNT